MDKLNVQSGQTSEQRRDQLTKWLSKRDVINIERKNNKEYCTIKVKLLTEFLRR